MTNEITPLVVQAVILNAGIMAGVWFYARHIRFYSIVDVAWSFSIPATVFFYFQSTSTFQLRRILLLAMVSLWGLRLGSYIMKRLKSHFPKEDSRYTKLQEDYGANAPMRFLLFFQYQGLSIVFLTSVILVSMLNPTNYLTSVEVAGFILWFVAFTGEALADIQMQNFKNDPKNKSKVCDVGLWAYSRHPNYFFESLIWWAYFLVALAAPYGIYTVVVPLAMLLLLTKVTGIPPSEEQSLKSRGEAYRDYQRRVSIFIPWFPKRD